AGLAMNDLAQVSALCVKLYYIVYANRELTDRQYAALVKLFANYYFADPAWRGLPDESRELACEQASVAALRNWREYRRICDVEIPKRVAEWKRILGNQGYTAGGLIASLFTAQQSQAKRQLDAIFAFGGLKFDDYTLTEEGFIPHYGQRLIKE